MKSLCFKRTFKNRKKRDLSVMLFPVFLLPQEVNQLLVKMLKQLLPPRVVKLLLRELHLLRTRMHPSLSKLNTLKTSYLTLPLSLSRKTSQSMLRKTSLRKLLL
jgi:hypothetical protein